MFLACGTLDPASNRWLCFSDVGEGVVLWARAVDVVFNRLLCACSTDTLMFSCGFAIIIEGMPPEDSPSWVLHMFSFTVSSAICMLFLSTWLAMKLQMRMSKCVLLPCCSCVDAVPV